MSLVRADSAEGGSLELAPRVDDAIVVEEKQEEEQERELDEHEVALRQEYHEQMSAQIAALAVDIPHVSIMDGIESAIMFRRAHRKTKAEWNAERVRDFRVCKDGSDDKAKAAEEELENEIEAELAATAGADTASSFRVDADPDPFIRDYQFSSYKQSLRHLKAKNAPFSIRVLDLCGQLIGDNKLADVAYSLRRCPLHVLNLSDNNLTDQGMALLADVLRSLGQLDDLLLSHNDITDEGVEKIFGVRVYPPHLRKVDLSFNALGPKAAFTLGRMFQGDRTCRLSALYLGGKKNKKGLGDDFIRILVDFLTRPNARALRRLSVPNAGLAHDGVSAIAAYVTCAQEMEYLNITQNSLMDPVCRRFLRDALRNNKTMKEFACGSGGISRVEKVELQFAFSSQYTLTWNEKMSLAYQTAKELNKCHHMGHAIELVVTNNWQAAKPTPWHEFEPGDHSKVVTINKPPRAAAAAADVAKAPPALADGHGETAAAGEGEGGGIAPPESSVVTKESAVPAREAAPPIAVVVKSELLNIPFAILTMNMELSQHAKSALLSIDEVNTYVVRLTGQFEECEAWLEDNVAGFKPPSEMRQKKKKMILREDTVGKRKEDLLVMLEKFTSVAIVKTVQEGNKKKGKKKKSKKKKDDVQSWKKGAKGQRITLESVLLTIEQLRSSFIELADALQYLIGVGYLLRIRHLDAARKKRKADQVSAFTSKKEALAFAQNKNKKVDEPFGSEASIPYLKTLGIAGTYTFSLHVGAPAEEERRKRSVLAFEADRRRQESAAHKEALKNKKTRKLLGPRFQIFARGTFPTPRDEEGDDPYVVDAGGGEGEGGGGGGDGDEFPLEGVKDDKEEEAEKEESSEEESSDEEEEEEKEEEEGKNGKGERERTRFTVPKREMQRKYESLVIEDLAANKAGIKDLVSQLSRGNRRHIVRTLELPLAMPADRHGDPTVDVSVYIEVEEERSEPMESLRRLDSIKPRIAFEERVRARRSAHKYIREELASAV